VWLGEDEVSKRAFENVGIPHYATEADAVRGFMHLVHYREAQDLLMETPDSLPRDFAPDSASARMIVAGALRESRQWLDPIEVNRLLNAYDIPVAPVTLAETPDEAAAAARPILAEGGTVAVKVLSPDIVHKSDIGGVKLDLTSEDAVREATRDIFDRAERLKPGARVVGVTVQEIQCANLRLALALHLRQRTLGQEHIHRAEHAQRFGKEVDLVENHLITKGFTVIVLLAPIIVAWCVDCALREGLL